MHAAPPGSILQPERMKAVSRKPWVSPASGQDETLPRHPRPDTSPYPGPKVARAPFKPMEHLHLASASIF